MVFMQYSKRTLKEYEGIIRKFLDFTGKKPEDIGREDVDSFLNTMSTLHTKRMATYALRYLLKSKGLDTSIIPKIRTPYKPVIEGLNEYEVKYVVDNARSLKHKAMLALSWELGLKVGELVSLRVGDLDLNSWRCRINEGYYNINTSWVKEVIVSYLSSYLGEKDYPLFPGRGLNPMRVSIASIILKRCLVKAGFKCKPSAIRNGRILDYIKKGVEIEKIAELMRIKNVMGLMRYYYMSDDG
jgi:integrase